MNMKAKTQRHFRIRFRIEGDDYPITPLPHGPGRRTFH
jgi:hypothetical protein